jgi:hypothetical protein
MRENISEIFQDLRKVASPILVDRLVRAVRQEKARAALDVLEENADPTVEALSTYLEYEMASALQNALDDGTLTADGFVTDNRETIKHIAKGAALGFTKLAQQPHPQ